MTKELEIVVMVAAILFPIGAWWVIEKFTPKPTPAEKEAERRCNQLALGLLLLACVDEKEARKRATSLMRSAAEELLAKAKRPTRSSRDDIEKAAQKFQRAVEDSDSANWWKKKSRRDDDEPPGGHNRIRPYMN